MLEKGQNWELFGYDMRHLGRYWVAAWRDLLWAHDSPVRQRLDEVVSLQSGDDVSYYQAGAPCPGVPESDCRALLLPDELVLSRVIRIPLQAEGDIAAILALEVKASSPFAASDTRWGWSVAARDESQLQVALVIVSASAVMAFLGQRHDCHDPRAQEVWVAIGNTMVVVQGFGEGLREQRYSKRLLHSAALLGAAAALLLAMAAAAAVFKSAELQRLEAMADAIMHDAAEASRLRTLLVQANESINAASEVVAQYPNPHLEIARLTRLLGDDASLTSFSMQGSEIRLRGKAEDAALVMRNVTVEPGYLEVTPGPITRQGKGQEIFGIDIRLGEELPE